MSKLTDEQVDDLLSEWLYVAPGRTYEEHRPFARAIESAATEPLLQRIAELEKALKLVQQHHATAWNRGHIAGMAANRMVAQDALNAVKKDAWNNTQLTEALMAAEGRCEELEQRNSDLYEDVQRFKKHALNEKAARMELERQLEEARKQMGAQKDEWLAWEAKRKALEKDAELLNWLALNPVEALDLFGRVTGDFQRWPKWIRSDIDAAMQKGQS